MNIYPLSRNASEKLEKVARETYRFAIWYIDLTWRPG